jgi:hypothetical protein
MLKASLLCLNKLCAAAGGVDISAKELKAMA